jgi:hypothetical protein
MFDGQVTAGRLHGGHIFGNGTQVREVVTPKPMDKGLWDTFGGHGFQFLFLTRATFWAVFRGETRGVVTGFIRLFTMTVFSANIFSH